MSQGRYVRALEEKRRRERYAEGTMRLGCGFLAAFVGIIYLTTWITPLAGGKLELRPTTVTIEQIERDGFPRAKYLEVSGGLIVFSEAETWIMSRDDGLYRLTAPVISQAQWRKWQESMARQEPIDAAQLRLAVSFTGHQVEELWPELKQQAEAGELLRQAPLEMKLTGDTMPGRFMVNKPMASEVRKENLDWHRVRHLSFGEHHHSLWNSVKNLAITLLLLCVSTMVFRSHLKRRGPIPEGDVDPVVWTVGDSGDLDDDADV